MMNFFLVPLKPTEWEKTTSNFVINPEIYYEAILEKWSSGKVFTPIQDQMYVLSWELDNITSGGLQKGNQFISLQPYSGAGLYEFTFWHRRFVPDISLLFLTSEISTDSLQITLDTTKEDFVTFTKSLINW